MTRLALKSALRGALRGALKAPGNTLSAFSSLLQSNAVAIYSTRALYPGYEDAVIRVRRSGDNAEADFTAAEVADGTMLAWVVAGAGTQHGYCSKIYDQVGSADQSMAFTARQPQIVASGVQLAIPLYGQAGNAMMIGANFASDLAQPGTIVCVVSRTIAGTSSVVLGGTDASKRWQIGSQDLTSNVYAGDVGYPTQYERNTTWPLRVMSAHIDNANSRLYDRNRWAGVGTAGTFPLSGLTIGGYITYVSEHDGAIDDCIVLDKFLDQAETLTVHSALATANGITLDTPAMQVENYTPVFASDTYYDTAPQCVVNSSNVPLLIFTRGSVHVDNTTNAVFTKYVDGAWTAPATLHDDASYAVLNSTVIQDSSGDIYAAFHIYNATTNRTVNAKLFKSEDGGDTWVYKTDLAAWSTDQRWTPGSGSCIEWPDTGSGRRIQMPMYSNVNGDGSGAKRVYVAECYPDTDDADWSNLILLRDDPSVYHNETALIRLDATTAIGVSRVENLQMAVTRTTDSGVTWSNVGNLAFTVATHADVSPFMFEFDGYVYLTWNRRYSNKTKMRAYFTRATKADLLSNPLTAWEPPGIIHASNHTTGLDFDFVISFEYNGILRCAFSDKVNSAKPDILISSMAGGTPPVLPMTYNNETITYNDEALIYEA